MWMVVSFFICKAKWFSQKPITGCQSQGRSHIKALTIIKLVYHLQGDAADSLHDNGLHYSQNHKTPRESWLPVVPPQSQPYRPRNTQQCSLPIFSERRDPISEITRSEHLKSQKLCPLWCHKRAKLIAHRHLSQTRSHTPPTPPTPARC